MAMQVFYELGPTGDGHRGIDNVSYEEAKRWLDSSIGFLRMAVDRGSVGSLMTLSSIHNVTVSDSAPAAPSTVFASVRDPVAAYAYQYAFTQRPGTTELVKTQLLQPLAVALSAERLQEAQARGKDIFQRCCAPKQR